MANSLQLGDIIRIVAPDEPKVHEGTFYIHYFDPDDFMECIHVSSMQPHTIRLKQGKIVDAAIDRIVLLGRSLHKGFARQNGLLPNTWVDLEFRDDVRSVIIAQITGLEEDMIELTTYPERDVLYIDFAYKGIPRHIPLKQICFVKQPASFMGEVEDVKPDVDTLVEDVKTEYNEEGEMTMTIPENIKAEEDYRTALHKEYVKNTPESLSASEEIEYESEIIRYGIDAQMNYLMDDFLSSVPDNKRTHAVMRAIYIHLNRFKELRELHSTTNEYGEITGLYRRQGLDLKPLAAQLYRLDRTRWALPVANVLQKMYPTNDMEEVPRDIVVHDLGSVLEEENTDRDQMFWKNMQPNEDNKYETMMKHMNNTHYVPYEDYPYTQTRPLALSAQVRNDQDVLLGTYNTHESSSLMNNVTVTTKYKTMRVHGPTMYSKYKTKKVYEMSPLAPSEKVRLQSMVWLSQKEVAETAHLHGSILEKSKYRAPYLFHLLHNTVVEERKVDDDLEKGILPLEDAISDVRYSFDDPNVSDHERYHKFLMKSVPSMYNLIEHYYKANANKYNMIDYLRSFSPYCIDFDEVSFKPAQSIGKHIFGNIQKYVTQYDRTKAEFVRYALEKMPRTPNHPSRLYDTFSNVYFAVAISLLNEVNTYYHLSSETTTQSISEIMQTDNGVLFGLMQMHLNWSNELIRPNISLEPIMEPRHFYHSAQKRIAKKYESLQEMQADNDKRDLQFDEKYDKNPYDLLNTYRREMSEQTPETFMAYLQDQLAEKHGCSLNNTKQLAEELVQGFKLVDDGHYALLEIKPHLPPGVEECTFTEKEQQAIAVEASARKIQKYFKRVNHVWVYDPDVTGDSFASPIDLTCKVQHNDNKTFENQFGESMEAIRENIERHLDRAKKQLEIHQTIQKQKRFEKDQYFTNLGERAYLSESLPSPHQTQLDTLMHKSGSFQDRQTNLVAFSEAFCREPFAKEHQSWLYCKTSTHSVPLLPEALVILAKSALEGTYAATLHRLVKNRSIKFEDGRFIIVHGGYILDDIEFSDQGMEMLEDLDERDTWEAEDPSVSTDYEVDLNTGQKVYHNPRARLMSTLLRAICRNVYAPLQRIEDEVMTLCSMFVTKLVMSQKAHASQVEAELKKIDPTKDKKKPALPSYESYEKVKLLYITASAFIIAIQTLVPPFEPRRTFGSCVKILDGFPLNENSGHEGTLEYMGCILRKMQGDRTTLPWSAIPRGAGNVEKQLKAVLTAMIANDDVKHKLQTKRQYLIDRGDAVPTAIEASSAWSRFQPPLKETRILEGKRPLANITKPLHEALRTAMKKGDPAQWNHLGVYSTKINEFAMGVSDILRAIVKDKGSLLGKYGKTPWLENACCNELDLPKGPLAYFMKEDEKVADFVKFSTNIGVALVKANLYAKQPFLHMEKDRPSKDNTHPTSLNNVFCEFSEEMMYRTFIAYCHLDTPTKPIPHHLETFMTEKIPEYNPHGSIEEKIAFLKERGKTMTVNSFSSLMTATYRNNPVHLSTPVQRSYQEVVMETLDEWKQAIEDPTVENFARLFEAYVHRDEYGTKQMQTLLQEDNEPEESKEPEEDPEKISTQLLDALENFLQREIDAMREKLQTFALDMRYQQGIVTSILDLLGKWDNDLSHIALGHFTKNFLYFVCIQIPPFLNTDNAKSKSKTAKHALLMRRDIDDMNHTLGAKFESIERYQQSPIMAALFRLATPGLHQLYKFLKRFYGFFPLDRQSLYGRFFVFSLHFVFYHLVALTEQDVVITQIMQTQNESDDNSDDEDKRAINALEMEEMEIHPADRGTVQAELIGFIRELMRRQDSNLFYRDKMALSVSYEKIKADIARVEDNEKINMMKRFRKIQDHSERRAEKDLMKYHLDNYYIDPNVIKTYSRRRDNMLQTTDSTENDFLFMDGEENYLLDDEEPALPTLEEDPEEDEEMDDAPLFAIRQLENDADDMMEYERND